MLWFYIFVSSLTKSLARWAENGKFMFFNFMNLRGAYGYKNRKCKTTSVCGCEDESGHNFFSYLNDPKNGTEKFFKNI